jgi:hypothetical protein
MNFQLSQELILHAERNLQNAYGATPNYAINPTPEQALRSNRAVLPARVIAALDFGMELMVTGWRQLS